MLETVNLMHQNPMGNLQQVGLVGRPIREILQAVFVLCKQDAAIDQVYSQRQEDHEFKRSYASVGRQQSWRHKVVQVEAFTARLVSNDLGKLVLHRRFQKLNGLWFGLRGTDRSGLLWMIEVRSLVRFKAVDGVACLVNIVVDEPAPENSSALVPRGESACPAISS